MIGQLEVEPSSLDSKFSYKRKFWVGPRTVWASRKLQTGQISSWTTGARSSTQNTTSTKTKSLSNRKKTNTTNSTLIMRRKQSISWLISIKLLKEIKKAQCEAVVEKMLKTLNQVMAIFTAKRRSLVQSTIRASNLLRRQAWLATRAANIATCTRVNRTACMSESFKMKYYAISSASNL